MIKYETKRYGQNITPVEVDRETSQSIWVVSTWSGKRTVNRRAKNSQYDQYHDTWALAHAALMARAERELNYARRALQEAQSFHGNVKGMKEPQA